MLSLLLSTTLLALALGAAPAQAAPAPEPAPVAAAQPVQNPDQLSPEEWRETKRHLHKSSLKRTVEVANGTRTFTYTMETGGEIILEEPAGPQPDLSIQMSFGGCGWYAVCIYLTPTEQRMILQGNGYLLIATMCLLGGPAVCIIGGTIVTVALTFLNDRVCSYRLRMMVLPWVGRATCIEAATHSSRREN